MRTPLFGSEVYSVCVWVYHLIFKHYVLVMKHNDMHEQLLSITAKQITQCGGLKQRPSFLLSEFLWVRNSEPTSPVVPTWGPSRP